MSIQFTRRNNTTAKPRHHSPPLGSSAGSILHDDSTWNTAACYEANMFLE